MSSNPEIIALLIKHIQHRNFRLLETRLAPLGISIVQWNALRTIDRHPESCLRRLAQRTFYSDQAVGTLVARLRRLKLIQRLPGVGRACRHQLTPKGMALLQQGRELVNEALTEKLSVLTEEECDDLQGLLVKLLDDGPVDTL